MINDSVLKTLCFLLKIPNNKTMVTSINTLNPIIRYLVGKIFSLKMEWLRIVKDKKNNSMIIMLVMFLNIDFI